jgi:hypothetical protein
VFNEIYSRFKPGDIVLVSRLYLSRSLPYVIDELRPWLYNVSRLAEPFVDMLRSSGTLAHGK